MNKITLWQGLGVLTTFLIFYPFQLRDNFRAIK